MMQNKITGYVRTSWSLAVSTPATNVIKASSRAMERFKWSEWTFVLSRTFLYNKEYIK